jgi:hypothetical protein
MPTFQMEVVCQVLTITADDEGQAEEKYSAHFGEGDCPCGEGDCDCVDDSEDCYHITTDISEGEKHEDTD